MLLYLSFRDPAGAIIGAVVCLEGRTASCEAAFVDSTAPPVVAVQVAEDCCCCCGGECCNALTFMRAAVPIADNMQTSSEILVDSLFMGKN